MKKLSLLIALLICVTIGGVYATWTYTSASADIVDGTKEVVIELAGATTSYLGYAKVKSLSSLGESADPNTIAYSIDVTTWHY